MESFYNNLFAIEVTLFGIVLAGIFVVLQMLQSSFSHQQIRMFVRDISFICFIISSLAVASITGLAGLCLSLKQHDFIKTYDFSIDMFLNDDYYSLKFLWLLGLSVALALLWIRRSISYISPVSMFSVYKSDFSTKNLRRFLYQKYGVATPHEMSFTRSIYEGIDVDAMMKIYLVVNNKEAKSSLTEALPIEQQVLIAERQEKAAKDFETATRQYENMKKDSIKGTDVFEGFSVILNKAIASADTLTVKEGCRTLTDISATFLVSLPKFEEKASWFPESELRRHFARYLCEIFKAQLEACYRHDTSSLAPYFIRMTREIAVEMLRTGDDIAMTTILTTWKDTANQAIENNDRTLFNEIIRAYDEVGEVAFDVLKEKGDNSRASIDEVFRQLGWIGERLITKKEIEKKPLIYDSEYQNEYDVFLNVLLGYGYKYNHESPNVYPLIYFDAVDVVFFQLLKIYAAKDKEGQDVSGLKDTLFSLVHVFSSFALDAVKAGNIDGVSLAALRLRGAYKEAEELGAEKCSKDIIGEIVRVSMAVGANQEILKKPSHMGISSFIKDLDDIIATSPYNKEINAEIQDFSFRVGGNYEESWKHIRSLGIKRRTNFGMMFDEVTGEPYSDGDPRRP